MLATSERMHLAKQVNCSALAVWIRRERWASKVSNSAVNGCCEIDWMRKKASSRLGIFFG